MPRCGQGLGELVDLAVELPQGILYLRDLCLDADEGTGRVADVGFIAHDVGLQLVEPVFDLRLVGRKRSLTPHHILYLCAHEVVAVAPLNLVDILLDARHGRRVGFRTHQDDGPAHQPEVDRDKDADDPVE